ncbi:keratin-associated protein 17-1 [Drosophila kikkawai]|uniref:Keratin-associated protein 17-1 n=1 Tax=Drosophila kikkawai TaxID=30033 RepID=A0A6P4HTD9_DROKI|nr:keratin-associated protein 5-9 [Drosophila kikkawai]
MCVRLVLPFKYQSYAGIKPHNIKYILLSVQVFWIFVGPIFQGLVMCCGPCCDTCYYPCCSPCFSGRRFGPRCGFYSGPCGPCCGGGCCSSCGPSC